MTHAEFTEQEAYCRAFNTPEGPGCDECPAIDKDMCADKLRGLCGKLLKTPFNDPTWKQIAKKIQGFGLTPFNILGLYNGAIEFND